MKDLINEYSLEKGYNCAEMMLIFGREKLEVKIGEQELAMIKGFGGGMQREGVCGVITGGVALLSIVYQNKDNLKQKIIRFQELFAETVGYTNCEDLKPIFRDAERRCADLIEKAMQILEIIIVKEN